MAFPSHLLLKIWTRTDHFIFGEMTKWLFLFLPCYYCDGYFASLYLLSCNRPLQIDKAQGLQNASCEYFIIWFLEWWTTLFTIALVLPIGAADAAGAVGDVLGDTDSDCRRSCSQSAHCHLQQIQVYDKQFYSWIIERAGNLDYRFLCFEHYCTTDGNRVTG